MEEIRKYEVTVFSPLESRSESDQVSFLATKDKRAGEEPPVYMKSQGEEAGARPSASCRVLYGLHGARGLNQWGN